MENNLNIEQIKKVIEQLKIEIIEKENKIEELLKIINKESDEQNVLKDEKDIKEKKYRKI